ncbi:putative Xre family DNA-binding protein [Agrobacterium rubi TR3 = NBRC 13261]|uniref:Putative Xre family DNA-binding protein n=2 Tax=Agrobacterium rubi TaxID=28099 RepID=A0A081CUE7_9HYPH|nr:helix-turn-helix transcriptional regulator [Agrobacterium rubi]GAK70293.1 putative Xre family DNA-binding protein [Agrobacterium rubi TR3 = NBRC 13261]
MPKDQNVTGNQISAARMLAEISQKDLAERANVSVPTIKRMEGSGNGFLNSTNNVAAVITALEQAGIRFVDDGQASAAGGPGVRLLKSPGEFDTDQSQTVQYPEHLEPDAPTGAGG